ncbi:MarR family winged helix-turn-helix transcriptional regulator [Agromyces cerinus]|uniref:DNA-binding transcriptional regulator, MarR family n=1 Tax=Agromyces cerinus subsp. cerinus TaxID=232089 RepID=A0A1N6HLJ6_9MICO|nr:MarR family winged helix-turn-helix transcriptional regulator [Agromyces cerinus]SIO20724.1 DNA-binding transcriptional regulator, MarR family [Agromyces cerinus subsp. cerinus]
MSDDSGQASIEVGLLLHQVYTLATQRLNDALRPMNLASRHVTVMFLIRDGVETQRDLVARLNTDKTGMVRVIDDLDRLGYVTRTPSTLDRRVTLLALTTDGEDALRTAQQHTKRVSAELFHAVSPHELGLLKSILMRTLTPIPSPQPVEGPVPT